MWCILFKSVVTVLVIYALIDIFHKIIVAVFLPEAYKNENTFVVIKVKNHEATLEGIVRTLIWKYLNLNNGGYIPDILIVDTGSDDETRLIAERLSNDYSFVFYTTEEQFEKMKNTFK